MNESDIALPGPFRRVLVVHNRYLQAGGEARVFEAEEQLLRRHGHTLFRHVEDNRAIRRMGRTALVASTVWNKNAYRQIRDLVERESIEIAHFHNTFPLLSPSVLAAASHAGAVVVQTLHNYRLFCPSAQFFRDGAVCEECADRMIPFPAIRHACYRDSRSASAIVAAMQTIHNYRMTWIRYVDLFVVPSRFTRDVCIRLGLPEERVRVKPHFLSSDPGPGPGSGRFVLFVGRLAPEKGLETLLSAARQLSGDVEIRIVGDGPLSSRASAAAETIPGVSWLGGLSNDDVLRLIGEASCVVIPSETYETFGLVVIEAFAKGTPVVVTRHGALAELVSEGITGWTFEAGSARDLAVVLRYALRNDESAKKTRQQARLEFLKHYTAPQNYRLLIDAYKQAAVLHGTR